MKSDLPKVLHPVCGRPMLGYVLDLVEDLKIPKVVMVLGHRQMRLTTPYLPQRLMSAMSLSIWLMVDQKAGTH